VDFTLSRPVKILALVGVIAAVGGAGVMTLKKPGQPTTSSAGLPTVAQLRARAHARHAHATVKTPAAKPATKAKHSAAPAKPAAKHATPVRPKATPVAPPKTATTTPAVTTPAAPPVAANGLPLVLAEALMAHKVVVVSLFDPQSQTDAISYAEAKAGAAAAGVGFLGVNLLDDAVTSPLTATLPGGGLLPDPGVLVYSAPGTLVLRLDGFNDRDAVAQAAAQAQSGRSG
jgi:hypothetical protein